jgi:hypothetical protein
MVNSIGIAVFINNQFVILKNYGTIKDGLKETFAGTDDISYAYV